MQEHCGLCYFCLLELLVSSIEHDVSDTKSENVVCFLKELFGDGVLFIKVFAHAYELCSLARKYECVHYKVCC